MAEKNKEVVPLTEEQLKQKETELTEKETSLNEKEVSLNQKEKELTKKEADLSELEETLINSTTEDEVAEPIPGLDFKIDKEKFKFKDSSPKNLRVGGKTLSQAEIIKDKDLLQKLVKGPHIEKIK